MAARFGRDKWSLVVPDGWRAWHDDECATLVGPGGIGALQISAAFKDSEVVDMDLREFAAEHLEAGAKARPCEAGDFVGFELCYADEERVWRQWYLRNGRQMLFVTYNCGLESRGVEDGGVGVALASLVARSHDVASRADAADSLRPRLSGKTLARSVTSLADLDLHDATLVSASITWSTQSVDVVVQPCGPERGSLLRLRAFGCTRVVIPNEAPWGASASVNSHGFDGRRFWIEMQSGDTIEIWADRVEVV